MSDDVTFDAIIVGEAANGVGILRRDNHTKTEAHVVGEKHLLIRNRTVVLNKPENRMGFRQAVDHVADVGSGSAHVQETGAGNMRQCFDLQIGFKHGYNFFNVDAGRLQQFFSDRSSEFTQVFVHFSILKREEDPACQRETVAVHAC